MSNPPSHFGLGPGTLAQRRLGEQAIGLCVLQLQTVGWYGRAPRLLESIPASAGDHVGANAAPEHPQASPYQLRMQPRGPPHDSPPTHAGIADACRTHYVQATKDLHHFIVARGSSSLPSSPHRYVYNARAPAQPGLWVSFSSCVFLPSHPARALCVGRSNQ